MEEPSRTLTDLFSSVAAWLRQDLEAVHLLAADIVDRGQISAFVCGAVMTAAEYLLDASDVRDIEAERMVDLLLDAHNTMASGSGVTHESLVLEGARQYLFGAANWWEPSAQEQLVRAPRATVLAGVRVTAGALTWHARDIDTDPITIATHTCWSLAERSYLPTA